jgi:hypothetical protein
MNRSLCVLCAASLLAAVSVCAWAQDEDQPAPNEEAVGEAADGQPAEADAPEAGDEEKADRDAPGEAASKPADQPVEPSGPNSSFTDDMERLNGVVGLNEKQTAAISRLRQDRDKALANWDKQNEKQLQRAREALDKLEGEKNERARKDIEARVARINKSRENLFQQYEKRMFALLDPAQRGKWNGPLMQSAVIGEFESLSLNEKQLEDVKGICATGGSRLAAPFASAEQQRVIESLKAQIVARVLTKEQRTAYMKAHAKGAAPRREGRPRQDGEDG